jgi:hypothetical protein
MTDAFKLLRIASLSLATGVFAAGAYAQAPATGSTGWVDFRPKYHSANRLPSRIANRLAGRIANRLVGRPVGHPVQAAPQEQVRLRKQRQRLPVRLRRLRRRRIRRYRVQLRTEIEAPLASRIEEFERIRHSGHRLWNWIRNRNRRHRLYGNNRQRPIPASASAAAADPTPDAAPVIHTAHPGAPEYHDQRAPQPNHFNG